MSRLNKSDNFGVENNDDMKPVKSRAADEVEEWGDSTDEITWFSSCQVLDQDGGETASKEAPLLPRHKHEDQLQLIVDCMSLDDLDFDEEASAQISENKEFSESKRKRAANALPSSLKLLNNFQNRFRRLTGEKVNAAPGCSSQDDQSREMNCCSSTRLWINEILQLAAHKFIENSSHGDSELNNNRFPSSCWGLNEEDSKDVELLLYLLASAEKVGQKKFDSAKELLTMCDKLSSKNGNAVQRLVYYFSEALCDKVDWQTGEKTSENFGKKQFEFLKEELMSPKQCILATHQTFPFSQVIEFASVQAVIEHVAEAKRIHIIDLEIRHGMQWTILMQALAARHAESFIENLRISALGVKSEPMIEETGKRLTSFADSLKIPFSFKTVMVGDILEVNEHTFEVDEDEALAVYAQYYFMAMISKQDRLEHLMRAIRAIHPRVMVIIEVEANHNSPVFVNRFIESLFFYSAFFDSLEHFMKREESIRTYVECEHLSRGIRNIVAAEGEERMIRHVSINVWRAFFARFGMKEVELSMSSVLQANLVLNNFSCGKYCTLDRDGDSLIIGWKGTPLLSVSAWKLI